VDIRQQTIGSIRVISLHGDLDGRSSSVAQEQILPALPADGRVLLDLSDVPFISSAGLRTMLLIYRQAQCVNSTVALLGLSDELRGVLSATGFLAFFIVTDSLTGGVEALRAETAGPLEAGRDPARTTELRRSGAR
jgi:anti-sigma B factor antagonist